MFTKSILAYLFLVSIVSFNLVARITISPPTKVGIFNRHPDCFLKYNIAKLCFPRPPFIDENGYCLPSVHNFQRNYDMTLSLIETYDDSSKNLCFTGILVEIREKDYRNKPETFYYELMSKRYFDCTYGTIVLKENVDRFLRDNNKSDEELSSVRWPNLSYHLGSYKRSLGERVLCSSCQDVINLPPKLSQAEESFFINISKGLNSGRQDLPLDKMMDLLANKFKLEPSTIQLIQLLAKKSKKLSRPTPPLPQIML